MEIKNTNKKAQEEVMGFVIIILLVIIIGLVFFAFSLRQGTVVEPEKAELDDFINSMLVYTSNCEISAKNQTIRELARQCNNNPNKKCGNNQEVCDLLNNTLKDMFEKLQGAGTQIANSYIHGYEFNITGSHQITYIAEGTQEGDYFTSTTFIPTGQAQDITVKLKFYYSKEA
ncbi:MAG: hypothetical protein ACPLXC_01780 [Candidatus Pacearchaeota archaeon]